MVTKSSQIIIIIITIIMIIITNFHIYMYIRFAIVPFKCYGNVEASFTNILVYHMSLYD